MSIKNSIVAYFILFVLVSIYMLLVLPVKNSYTNRVNRYREAKNFYFKVSEDTPLDEGFVDYFNSLNYFPINEKYLVDAGVKFYKQKDTVELTLLGNEQGLDSFAVQGEVVFFFNKKPTKLKFFKHLDEPDDEHYFLPFYDVSNAKNTYSNGRYIDLYIDSNKVVQEIDFNLAYNPFCSYNDKFNCPTPPKENRINWNVEAGEMRFLLGGF